MRRTIAESIRHIYPDLAEALEERLFSDEEIAEELRIEAYRHKKGSGRFFTLLAAASSIDDLGGAE